VISQIAKWGQFLPESPEYLIWRAGITYQIAGILPIETGGSKGYISLVQVGGHPEKGYGHWKKRKKRIDASILFCLTGG
jgi:hypothetical protein